MLSPETFDEMIEVATLIGGPKMGLRPNETMGVEHHHFLVNEKYKGFDLNKYRRGLYRQHHPHDGKRLGLCAAAASRSLAYRKDGSAVDDTRGTYGELGRVAVSLLKHMQRTPGVDIIFVGLLDRREDEAHRIVFVPQMMGGMTARELPGIVDHVISMVRMDFPDAVTPVFNWENGEHRVFVCRKGQPVGASGQDPMRRICRHAGRAASRQKLLLRQDKINANRRGPGLSGCGLGYRRPPNDMPGLHLHYAVESASQREESTMAIDLNDAPDQREMGAVMPDGTFVWLIGHIKRGGASIPGEAAGSPDIGAYKASKTAGSDALMLDWEFTVDLGQYKGRKVFQNMVVTGGSVDESGHSKAGTISRGQLKAMVNSGTGLDPKDESPAAKAGRIIPSMSALDGIPFAARLGIEASEGYADKNIIAHVVEPGEPEYADIRAGKDVEPKPSGVRKARGAAGLSR